MRAGKGLVGALLLAALALSGCAAAPDAPQYDLAAGEIAVAPGLTLGMAAEELPEGWTQTEDPDEWEATFPYAGISFEGEAQFRDGELRRLQAFGRGDQTREEVEAFVSALNADYGIELVNTTLGDNVCNYNFRRNYHALVVSWDFHENLSFAMFQGAKLPLTMEELLEEAQK